jgi:hypothetical protein
MPHSATRRAWWPDSTMAHHRPRVLSAGPGSGDGDRASPHAVCRRSQCNGRAGPHRDDGTGHSPVPYPPRTGSTTPDSNAAEPMSGSGSTERTGVVPEAVHGTADGTRIEKPSPPQSLTCAAYSWRTCSPLARGIRPAASLASPIRAKLCFPSTGYGGYPSDRCSVIRGNPPFARVDSKELLDDIERFFERRLNVLGTSDFLAAVLIGEVVPECHIAVL